MSAIQFIDTTLRDGQMSLWATNMTTGMILPIAEPLDQAGFLATEIMSAASFNKMVRELREDPWQRVRLAGERIKQTRLRCIRSRFMAAFHVTPPAVSDLWVERLAANGIHELRGSDSSNSVWSWEQQVRAARNAGIDQVINVIFTLSPLHTNAYYAEKVRAAAALRPFRICLKDPGGLLTPDRTRTLAPVFLENAGDTPVELHTHCNAGLGPLCVLEAVRAGIHLINTAIPPLANASSLPSIYNTAANLRTLGYTADIDEAPLQPITAHFTAIGKRHGFTLGAPVEYDEFHYQHQVPGGMISNLRFQLAQVGAGHRLREVLEECIRVRADLGYPIMVTPYSQFVGSQATINIITGERYKQVTDQVIQYVLGHWGEEERSAVDPTVRDQILDRPRARELARWEPPQTTVKELRETLGGPGVSDDELLLRYFSGEAEVNAMKAMGPRDAGLDATDSLSALVHELTRRPGIRHLQIDRPGFTLHVIRP